MVLLAVGLLALVLLVAGLAFQHVLRHSLRSAAIQAGRVHLDDLASAVGRGQAERLTARGAETLVQVVDARGRLLASSADGRAVVDAPRLAPGRTAEVVRSDVPASEPDNEYLVLGRGVRTPSGPVTVYVAVAVDDATDPADRTRTLGLVLLPALLAGFGVVGWSVVGRTLAPVERMRRTAETVTGTALDARVVVPDRDDEIARLGRTLNAMLDRLDESQQAQRRFLADAAHELRTPLASARAQLDADLPATSGDARRHRDLSHEIDRMQHLVEGLLLLARSDLHALRPHLRLVDVDDAVHAAVTRAALRHDLPVALDLTPAQVRADPQLLEQVLDNLLDNAERHAASRVAVGVARRGSSVEIRVDDDGPGIPVHLRAAAFERFTRLDTGRARTEGGAGLGLAIVRDLVEAHGGSVDIGVSALGGARFTVRLAAELAPQEEVIAAEPR